MPCLAALLDSQNKAEEGQTCAWVLGIGVALAFLAAIGNAVGKRQLRRNAESWFTEKKGLRAGNTTPEAIERWIERGEKLAAQAEKGATGKFGKDKATTKGLELLAIRIRDDVRAFETVQATIAARTNDVSSPTITELARLRSEGMISEEEFKAFASRFERTAGEKAQEVLEAIGKLHEQHTAGAMSEGNYKASLWSLLDRLDRGA
jgi:hypothetical protein